MTGTVTLVRPEDACDFEARLIGRVEGACRGSLTITAIAVNTGTLTVKAGEGCGPPPPGDYLFRRWPSGEDLSRPNPAGNRRARRAARRARL